MTDKNKNIFIQLIKQVDNKNQEVQDIFYKGIQERVRTHLVNWEKWELIREEIKDTKLNVSIFESELIGTEDFDTNRIEQQSNLKELTSNRNEFLLLSYLSAIFEEVLLTIKINFKDESFYNYEILTYKLKDFQAYYNGLVRENSLLLEVDNNSIFEEKKLTHPHKLIEDLKLSLDHHFSILNSNINTSTETVNDISDWNYSTVFDKKGKQGDISHGLKLFAKEIKNILRFFNLDTNDLSIYYQIFETFIFYNGKAFSIGSRTMRKYINE